MILIMEHQKAAEKKPRLPPFSQLVSDFGHSAVLGARPAPVPLPQPPANRFEQQQVLQVHPNAAPQPIYPFAPNQECRTSYITPAQWTPHPSNHSQPPRGPSLTHPRTFSLGSGSFASVEIDAGSPLTAVPPSSASRHHRKTSSLNSIGELSLQKAAKETEELQRQVQLVHSIELMVQETNRVQWFAQSVKLDLAQRSSSSGELDSVRLGQVYGGSNAFIKQEEMAGFLQCAPLELLESVVKDVESVRGVLKRWIVARKEEVGRRGGALKLSRSASSGTVTGKKRQSQKERVFIKMGHDLKSSRGGGGGISGGISVGIDAGLGSGPTFGTTNIATPLKHPLKKKNSDLGLNRELSVQKKMVCMQCGETQTPEWRRGPYGVRTLCNACGLFHGKLVKRVGVQKAAEIMLKRREEGVGSDRHISNDEEEEEV